MESRPTVPWFLPRHQTVEDSQLEQREFAPVLGCSREVFEFPGNIVGEPAHRSAGVRYVTLSSDKPLGLNERLECIECRALPLRPGNLTAHFEAVNRIHAEVPPPRLTPSSFEIEPVRLASRPSICHERVVDRHPNFDRNPNSRRRCPGRLHERAYVCDDFWLGHGCEGLYGGHHPTGPLAI